ncbi:MAG: chorismate-binding protein, partial [Elusimicrobiota bacterium]
RGPDDPAALELQPLAHRVYCGSIGYLGFDGTMDLNIAIRTITVMGGQAYFHAGGGIVADSQPDDEYDETLHKARALANALGQDLTGFENL